VTDPQPSSASGFEQGSFEKTCAYCGAHFQVDIARRSGENVPQPFACPECGRTYEVRAAQAIMKNARQVFLVAAGLAFVSGLFAAIFVRDKDAAPSLDATRRAAYAD